MSDSGKQDQGVPGTTGTPSAGPAAGPAAGITQLGRYQIKRELGRGAMGVVYEGEDPKIGRRVALKILHEVPGVSSQEMEEFKSRFHREARTAGMLSHPNIVVIYDVDDDPKSGVTYMAMELLKGQPLNDLLKSGVRFTRDQAVDICLQVAEGLDHAHRQGIVHRDVKPANLMLLEDGTVKITDFGIAKISTSNLTKTGQFLGTPNYMSPEQVIGHVVDGRSDLFSLGIILYELLTGEKPFMGSSLTTITYQIVNVDPIEPSKIQPGIPKVFDAIVAQLLRKAPDERFQTGKDVAEALRQAREGGVVGGGSAATKVGSAAQSLQATRISQQEGGAVGSRTLVSGQATSAPGSQPASFGATLTTNQPGSPAAAGGGTLTGTAPAGGGKALWLGLAAIAVIITVIAAVIVMRKPAPVQVASASGPTAPAASASAPPGPSAPAAATGGTAPLAATAPAAASAPAAATAPRPAGPTGATAPKPPPRTPSGPTGPPKETTGSTPLVPPAAAQIPAPKPATVEPEPAAPVGTARVRLVFEHELKSGSISVLLGDKKVASYPFSSEKKKGGTVSQEFEVPDGTYTVRLCLESPDLNEQLTCPQKRQTFVMNTTATIRATHVKVLAAPPKFFFSIE